MTGARPRLRVLEDYASFMDSGANAKTALVDPEELPHTVVNCCAAFLIAIFVIWLKAIMSIKRCVKQLNTY